jgi:hypothetical protein
MNDHDVFWKLEAISDRQLLERLGSVLGSSRRLIAELIAHLGEVEERRLHLVAACSSMFAYCLKLGMTEDEAYRRIEVARLARRYPAIFPLLAAGQLTISAVALLKHYLSDENHLELLAAVAGKSVMQTRELIAGRFPRPDVASSVRKLPERRAVMQSSLTCSMPIAPRGGGTGPRESGTGPRGGETGPRGGGIALAAMGPNTCGPEPSTCGIAPHSTSSVTGFGEVPSGLGVAQVASNETPMSFDPAVKATGDTPPERPAPSTHSQHVTSPRASARIEPLSADRYKVQFTASAGLARKLELAKDLMRHSHPYGELGPIVERALDLLIDSLMHQRFGKSKKASAKRTSERGRYGDAERLGDVTDDGSTMPGTTRPTTIARGTAESPTAESPTETTLDTAEPATKTPATKTPATKTPATKTPATKTPATKTPATKTPAAGTLDTAEPATPTTLDIADVQGEHPDELARASASSYLPRSARRSVVERDGLGCSWVDEHGVRCGCRSWLEYDHRRPRAKGGGSEPDNLRLLCRTHNRFAAEREYGRKHVEHSIAERRRERAPHAI